jgi:hypothetical protein
MASRALVVPKGRRVRLTQMQGKKLRIASPNGAALRTRMHFGSPLSAEENPPSFYASNVESAW